MLIGRIVRVAMLLLAGASVACGRATPSDHPPAGKTASPFAAASGITRAAEGPAFRVVPCCEMPGDVEILYGDPEKAGEPFAMRIRELPGTIVPLHSHPVDEHITIVQGTWLFAVGDTWDKTALRELRAGDYAFAAKGRTMFAASPDGAIVQVHGVGPFHIRWLHGVKTLDDADAASTFSFGRGERVRTPRGAGTIRNGYASGTIIQYEVTADNGGAFMVTQAEAHRETR